MKSWRRSRPFWGGVFIVAAGLEQLSISLAIHALPVAVIFGTVGAGYLIALALIIAGALVWLQPGQRLFLGLIAVLLSLASFVYSNLGGFLLGMILGLLGGMLAVAWTPISRPAGRLDTVTVRSILAAARTCTSRVSVPRWTTAIAVGQRCRRLVPMRRARIEADSVPADTSSLAKRSW
ncbi:hypothetical protein FH608_040980 [Nonomuraea phyllanthi]|uniref:Uncharacterized protein n=1 Tax=Nonomuraea phyllanthi TaxID=2219224 RepID=A0A5C4VJB1_9ACTN|nr:DUF6114 domain-containing protein [Nonomuraea phyllanthi]KAB8189211.1 hypothetical protein FH608_040980 [Nonomuraea phyllanthi]QFY10302.1 hypothetical protein GBF35_30020 [Nonomuraea phyllanthi]